MEHIVTGNCESCPFLNYLPAYECHECVHPSVKDNNRIIGLIHSLKNFPDFCPLAQEPITIIKKEE